jgi:hypothetical protein
MGQDNLHKLWISSANDLVISTKKDHNIKLIYDDGSSNISRLVVTKDGGGLYGTWTPPNWSSDKRLKHDIESLGE